jgi:class 3 adenylate cyclase/tetratricopeptide (TPR) repeat protein
LICGACGTENAAGKKFCVQCGTALALACANCSSPLAVGERFCGECGTPVADVPPVARSTDALISVPSAIETPTAERRLVSVLFADLVGFTTLSESRDSEEVRELLSKYFDTCSTLIRRYGGVVEKFIGDAVMAVWGTPVATEDDAERAVRAALDLTKAVAELGTEAGSPDLRARAGVLTGEAAVTIGAQAEGMVAGDLVNTASRIQSAAEPGRVFVGESTMRASEASIVYEDAGEHEMKGKAEPMRLWRAVRVVAGSLGALRTSALEAPFVGRDRELRMIKELFHGSTEERKAALVSVTGIAGIGKSRLSWEFEKYIDGLVVTTLWHRGRCLSYGEGVAYWALADMVKMRCSIAEEEDAASAIAKLRTTIQEFIPDPKEQSWVEPRLAHLLALDGGITGDQENVFSAWRIFFERLAERSPVVMVFEDMQWADAGLLDFIEYLLEWSRNQPIFILGLARPELADKRPTWGAGKRSFSSLYLEPLSAQAMEELLSGLVPGLPDDVRKQILDRAQGVPLYAVETVRMLLDRGLLAREESVYRPTGPIESLEVPETLHGLIAARLDGLSPEERRVVQDGAVLGKTFFKQGIARVSDLPEEEAEQILSSLVRKEVVSLQADPRSPERGQYGFLQDLVRKVAYDTLSKKDRKAKHLAAASFIEESWSGEEEEIVEVVAAHYLSAYEAAPEAEDASEIRDEARQHLVSAGERAASLSAPAEAQRYFEQAVGLTDDPPAQAELRERAGIAAWTAARSEDAVSHFEQAVALYEGAGASHPAARVSARLAETMWDRGRLEHGLEMMERSFELLSSEEPDEDLASLAAQLGRFLFFAGRLDTSADRIETALHVAEALRLPEVLSQALNTKSLLLYTGGRPLEGSALLRYALEVALENDKPSAALRAYYNLADMLPRADRYDDAVELDRDGLALARRVGNRLWEGYFLGHGYPLVVLGEWDRALEMSADIDEDAWTESRGAFIGYLMMASLIRINRGERDEAGRLIRLFADMADSAEVQERMAYACCRAAVLLDAGEFREAVVSAEIAIAARGSLGVASEGVKEAFVIAIEAAFGANDLEKVQDLLDIFGSLPPGERTQFLDAQWTRFRARLDVRNGNTQDVEARFKGAVGSLHEISAIFHLATTLLDFGTWLTAEGRLQESEPLLEEAREIFERLQATPWVERVDAVATSRVSAR